MKIDFAENRNMYMPNKNIIKDIKQSLVNISNYPDCSNNQVNADIANSLSIPPEYVTIVKGTMEGINLFASIFQKKKTAIFVPTFWGYEDSFKRFDVDYEIYDLNKNLHYDLDKINYIASTKDFMFLCNPNNPTLSYIEKEELVKLIKSNSKCHFIIDETMLIFDIDFDNKTVIKEVLHLPNLSILLSYSKIYGLANVRGGTVISSPSTINKIKSQMIPYSVSEITQTAISSALKYSKELLETKNQILKDKLLLINKMHQLGAKQIIDGPTSFILVELPDGISAKKLSNYLQTKNIFVRDITKVYPKLKGEWIRISSNTAANIITLYKEILNYYSHFMLNLIEK